MKSVFILCLVIATGLAAKVHYDNFQVLRIFPTEERWKQDLERVLGGEFDIWRETKERIDIMVGPKVVKKLTDMLKRRNIDYDVMVEDIQSLIDQERPSAKINIGGGGSDFDYNVYHTYGEIMTWVTDFASANKGLVTEVEVGESTEGRIIKALRIGSQSSNNPGIYFQGGIHAREWISPATMINLARKLVEEYGSDDTATKILDAYDLYIIPTMNVDGYVYTHTNDRMWRKNRKNYGTACTGVDMNRNYPTGFGGKGASSNPCSETYHGPKNISEVEMEAVTTFFLDLVADGQDFHLFIDFHAYGQLWLFPWGYSRTAPIVNDYNDLSNGANAAAAALKSVHGTEYFVGNSARDMYPAGGASEDWGYDKLKAKYSYIIELRDEGRHGFLLPEKFIEPTGDETYAGMKNLFQTLLDDPNPIQKS
ncbi:carboxypeptidase B-like [Antedon mediterranea]|uniref:carboxypeptidase B-like n=1 Tax=Antedon mediterranea TaxID=105859 RepID=UPI003AF78452